MNAIADKKAKDLDHESLVGQVDAINRSQSVIEFEMDGTIITANENFLRMMGYELDEIIGKHHSIFAETNFAESPEYREFWDKLGRGEYQAAEFKRIGKGGAEVWIQGSYNPIFDRDSKPYKVVKFATDITERKETEEIVNSQQRSLLELSTPSMQLFNGVVLMPLVGNIDASRATEIITRLLDTITRFEAEVAILDVTGVPNIDTYVAGQLLKAINAAKMLGATVILTGISANGAQTLAQLGVELSHVITKGSLRSGLEEAIRMTGQTI
jgi:PAS domain S-box-containing protein